MTSNVTKGHIRRLSCFYNIYLCFLCNKDFFWCNLLFIKSLYNVHIFTLNNKTCAINVVVLYDMSGINELFKLGKIIMVHDFDEEFTCYLLLILKEDFIIK